MTLPAPPPPFGGNSIAVLASPHSLSNGQGKGKNATRFDLQLNINKRKRALFFAPRWR
jgi:hypothetical protein